VLKAAEVRPGCRVLDVSTGTGEAALMALPIVGPSGLVVGADISPAMLKGARDRLCELSFRPVAADGQALPFRGGSFDVPVHVGRRMIVLQISIYRPDGKLAAMMIHTQMVLPRESAPPPGGDR
jgi:SAM-dependent methyltransferase